MLRKHTLSVNNAKWNTEQVCLLSLTLVVERPLVGRILNLT